MQNRLVEFLKGKGLSGRELARQLGLSVSYVSLVLKGSRPVTFYFAAAVADGFGLDPLEAFYMAGLLKMGTAVSGNCKEIQGGGQIDVRAGDSENGLASPETAFLRLGF